MQCCPKGTDAVYNSLTNVPVGPEEVMHLIAYITINNCIQQSYLLDKALYKHHDIHKEEMTE